MMSTQSNNGIPDSFTNPFKRSVYYFFWWCAGSDHKKLVECPTDYEKHFGTGVFILFTGIFAAVAMSYALTFVFLDDPSNESSQPFDIYIYSLGLLWGMFIFFLDRYIVSTMRKNEWYNQLLYAVPRFVLAFAISIGISKPLELRIFEDRLHTQRFTDKDKFVEGLTTKKTKEYGIDKLTEAIEKMENRIDTTKTMMGKEPPKSDIEYHQGIVPAYRIADSVYVVEKRINDSKIQEYQQAINRIMMGSTYKDNAGKLTRQGKELIAQKKSQKKSQTQNTLNLKNIRDRKYKDVTNYRIAYNKKIGLEVDALSKEKAILDSTKRRRGSLVEKARLDAEKEAEYSFRPSFAEQIISLETLIEEDKSGGSRQLNQFLIILFIIIETTPVLQKILSSRSPYDILVEKEYLTKDADFNRLKRQLLADELDEQNAIHQMETDRQESISATNREIYQTISQAQAEIGRTAIQRWKNDQLLKINTGSLSDFVDADDGVDSPP